jgi:hypothetical protein
MSATAAPKAVTPDIAGYVEAVTATAVLGWAWTPGDAQQRLHVELRLGDTVVSTAVADQLREDLARNGIGDGHHAFSLPVPESARARVAELRVFARTEDGDAAPIGSPPAPEGLTERLDRLQRGLESIAGSQRVLHRTLQSAVLSRAEAPASDGAAEAAQTALQQQVAALEMVAVRIDEKLAILAGERAAASQPPSRALLGALALSATALLVAIIGLIHSLPG